MLIIGLGTLQPAPASVGGINISGSDREVVDLTGWGTFRSSEVISGLIKGHVVTDRSMADC